MNKEDDLGDLTLPEDNSKADSKSAFDEKREMSDVQKKNLEKEKEFEFAEVKGREVREAEEKKQSNKEKIIEIAIAAAVLLLLVGLYVWLIH